MNAIHIRLPSCSSSCAGIYKSFEAEARASSGSSRIYDSVSVFAGICDAIHSSGRRKRSGSQQAIDGTARVPLDSGRSAFARRSCVVIPEALVDRFSRCALRRISFRLITHRKFSPTSCREATSLSSYRNLFSKRREVLMQRLQAAFGEMLSESKAIRLVSDWTTCIMQLVCAY